MMKIAINSENRAKISAVRAVFREVWKRSKIYIYAKKFETGVSEQPMSDEEGIKGAIHRARSIMAQIQNADYAIGMEGAVDENEFGMFLCGWTAILDKDGRVGLGSSAKVLLPEFMQRRINKGEELGPITQHLFNDVDDEIRHTLGTGGVLTKGLYSRDEEFKDAVRCALAVFVGSSFYQK